MTIHCPIVIDYIVPVSKPRARKTDAQTSHDAAVRVQIESDKTRREIYHVLKECSDLTCSEIAQYCEYDKVQIGKRIGEVLGIAPTGEQRNGERVWGLI